MAVNRAMLKQMIQATYAPEAPAPAIQVKPAAPEVQAIPFDEFEIYRMSGNRVPKDLRTDLTAARPTMSKNEALSEYLTYLNPSTLGMIKKAPGAIKSVMQLLAKLRNIDLNPPVKSAERVINPARVLGGSQLPPKALPPIGGTGFGRPGPSPFVAGPSPLIKEGIPSLGHGVVREGQFTKGQVPIMNREAATGALRPGEIKAPGNIGATGRGRPATSMTTKIEMEPLIDTMRDIESRGLQLPPHVAKKLRQAMAEGNSGAAHSIMSDYLETIRFAAPTRPRMEFLK